MPPSLTATFEKPASFGHRLFPRHGDLIALAEIGAIAEHAAGMPYDDVRAGKGARQADHIGKLGMIEPRVERQPHRGKAGETGAEIRALIEMRLHVRTAVAD